MEDDEVTGRLENLQGRRYVHRPRDTSDEAVRRPIVIPALGELPALHLRLRPRLHRQRAIRRMDDDAPATPREKSCSCFPSP